MKRKFPLGQIVATIGVLNLCKNKDLDLGYLIDRHVVGDWGDVGDESRESNERALKEDNRIVSIYYVHGVHMLIITEADRKHTIALLSNEYWEWRDGN